jgi:uncharacterized protein (DUF2062 family)
MFSGRRLKYLLRRFLRMLGKSTGSAHQIALGIGIGFFIAWLPIVGIQMVVAVIVCHFAKANKIVPIFPIWLTNPVTIIPVYSFNYWVGWKIVGGPPLTDLVVVLGKMVEHHDSAADVSWFEMKWAGIKQAMGELLAMGWDMQLPLWLGCAIVGAALALPSYYLTYHFVESFRKAVTHKKQRRQDRIRRGAGMDVPFGGSYDGDNRL